MEDNKSTDVTGLPKIKRIGEILAAAGRLSEDKIDEVLAYQTKTGLRFGESAVALKLVTEDDVLYALSQQFDYPYASRERLQLNTEIVVASQPFSQQAEAFRALRSQFLMRAYPAGMPKRALAVISPNVSDGKTFFAANLAAALSQLGGRTLIVDADMRGPRQHLVFGVPNTAGLSGLLSGRSGKEVILPVPDLPSLFVLPGGIAPPNPIELVERPAFALILKELVEKFDHVIVDTPAAWHGADATAVAIKCGMALCVAREGKSKLPALHELMSTLQSSSIEILGAVMNRY
jgi:protein-tyrosine kinase